MISPFRSRTDTWLALLCIAIALLAALAWIPADSGTGITEQARRRVTIGDALAPTIAAGVILLGALMTLFGRRLEGVGLSLRNLAFLGLLLAFFAISFALMRWTGPAVVALADAATGQELSYRALRDTAPWKYLGFVLGGGALIAGLIAAMEGRLRWRTVLIALVAVVLLAALYDLPFDDLLLPPNGDV
ncbi:hypothetical protein [Roseibium salinum]|uniref:Tripartite tricarboxylate transporter TctB family protein n=1 Tax=Roseibium salinum TaxID=1604349 RepID=A0ABT3QV90_9HYPH|nr:hypothetical protein [Roseibium sp. DSM 29163]MCX2720837.1 hypothetical protein [Roseibium sp. DSM 29163]MDN3722263.1 hypothetical protein [Roseibium salinum]